MRLCAEVHSAGKKCNGCEGIIKHNLNTSKGLYFIKIINTTTGQQTVKKITLQ